MQKKPMSLFYGAGVSMACGGPSGGQLLSSVKRQFPAGRSSNFLEYMKDIIEFDNSNRNEVETFIRGCLASISPQSEHSYLFSLPWRAILTTNYDRLPDLIQKTMDGRRYIIPVADPDCRIDPTRQDLLYCFKLLGDVDQSYPNGGWMVLSDSDLRVAFDRRSKFFRLFRNLASSGQIIYVGYSFEDNLVFDLLQEMRFVLKELPWKSYAVVPAEPSPDALKKMSILGITWVKGTTLDLVNSARKIIGNLPVSAPCISSQFIVHNFPMKLESATSGNVWRKFQILDFSMMEAVSQNPRHFLEGADRSFYPYIAKWDFPRKAKTVWRNPRNPHVKDFKLGNLVSDQSKSGNTYDNVVLAIVGSAGSGKTVLTNRIAFDWYRSGNPVIFINHENISIDTAALEGLLEEIWKEYLEAVSNLTSSKVAQLRFLLVADDCGSLLEQLVELSSRLRSMAKPVDILLVTRKSDVPLDRLKTAGVDCIFEIDDTLLKEEWQAFTDHFERLDVIHSRASLTSNLENREINSSFFALIYTSIREVQRPIRQLVAEEYQKLDMDSKRAYAIVCLLQSHKLTPWLSISLRSGGFDSNWLITQVEKGRLGGVLRLDWNGRALFASNRIIADIVTEVAFRTPDEVYSALRQIVGAVTSGDQAEMTLLHILLIDRIRQGVGTGGRLSAEQQIELFNMGISIARSRPLLLHLAMLQIESEKFTEAESTLREALVAHVPVFDERDEHVIDAKGRLQLRLAEKAMSMGDKTVAWEHLEKAEAMFQDAQLNPGLTPHPYQGLGRVYVDMASISPDEPTKWSYLLLAMQECTYVEDYIGGELNLGIAILKKEIITALDSINFDEEKVGQIKNQVGRSNGYAFLAERKIRYGKLWDALALVLTGLEQNPDSIWLMRLHVLLMKKLYPDDPQFLKKALDDYLRVAGKKYDVTLSFELAMETFKLGDYSHAMSLFRELDSRTKRYPMRLIPSEQNRWMEKGKPKEFIGTVIDVPKYGHIGRINCSSLGGFREALPVRYQDVEFACRGGERVVFNIIFNMIGPEASRVRKLAL